MELEASLQRLNPERFTPGSWFRKWKGFRPRKN